MLERDHRRDALQVRREHLQSSSGFSQSNLGQIQGSANGLAF